MSTTLSTRASEWSALPTAALHGKVLEMQNAGEDIIDLTIGISNRPIPKAGADAAINVIQNNDVPYTAIGGTSELKKAIQEKLGRENNLTTNLENILVSTGAKQAIFETLYTITNPGDEVMILSPYWAAYSQIATMLGLTRQFVDVDDIASLAGKNASEKLKVIILNNPHNPTGKVLSRDELIQVAEFAKANNLFVLADESYEKLVYEGDFLSFAPIAADMTEKVITIFSVSQSFSMMGWRLGYAVADKEIIRAMEAVQSSITAGASAVTQTAVAAIMNMENSYIQDLTADFNDRKNAIFPKLAEIPWLECQNPKSGPYFWCNITKLTDNSYEFCQKFLDEKRVAVMPGDAFGGKGWIRIGFNVQSTETLAEAVKRLSEFGNHYTA